GSLNWNSELGDHLASELFNWLNNSAGEPIDLGLEAFNSSAHSLAWPNFLRRYNVRSQLLILLKPSSSPPWLIGLWHTEKTHQWTDFERKLLKEIGRIVTVAIEKAMLYKRAQEATAREKLINRISQAISQSLDIPQILQTICEELVKNLHIDRCYFAEVRK